MPVAAHEHEHKHDDEQERPHATDAGCWLVAPGSGGLDFDEFRERIKDLPIATPVNLIEDDFKQMTLGGQASK